MDTQKLLDEIKGYSLDELKLIYETQKSLYTDEEMAVIQEQINEIEAAEKAAQDAWIAENLPEEILCPKCDGSNPFENDTCCFCGHTLDKSKYYDPNFYLNNENDEEESEITDNGQSYTFQFVISFLIPLVGFILGAILLGKDDPDEKSTGKTCIIIGLITVIISGLLSTLWILAQLGHL